MAPGTDSLERRNAEIDVFRGGAILMFISLHYSLTYRLWHSGPLMNLIGRDRAFSMLGWGSLALTMSFVYPFSGL